MEDGLPGNVHSIVEASTQAWTAPAESDAEAALNSLISLILMMPPDRVRVLVTVPVRVLVMMTLRSAEYRRK